MMATPDENKSVNEARVNQEQKGGKGSFDLEQIGQLLTEYSTRMFNEYAWKDVMERHQGLLGEIRTPEDWRQFPRDKPIRVVFFRDLEGPVVRWATQDKQLIEEIDAVQEKRYLATLDGDQFSVKRYDSRLRELQRRLITHEDLATYHPKAESGLRQGYITLKASDELIVHAKGDHILHL